MTSTLEDLQWKKFLVLNDGFVCLVDIMGNDASIAQAARVSYGKDIREEAKIPIDDTPLIRYLMRHRHTTPFEMVELKFLVRVPMDCWRQWIRHRTANVNEYSTRYTEAIDSQQKTNPEEWRLQAKSNKQGSEGFLQAENRKGYPPTEDPGLVTGRVLTTREEEFHNHATRLYQQRLSEGIAKEQARKDLPLSTYTEAYWKIDLHNLFHFLGLRMDSHAQQEIRSYATTIGEQIVKPLLPVAWQAFEDYRLNGMFLSALDIRAVEKSLYATCDPRHSPADKFGDEFSNAREKNECKEKLEKLGFDMEEDE